VLTLGPPLQASGQIVRGPPTTIIEAIFLVFNEAGVRPLLPVRASAERPPTDRTRALQWISEKYFPEGFDLWDVFFPSECVLFLARSLAPSQRER